MIKLKSIESVQILPQAFDAPLDNDWPDIDLKFASMTYALKNTTDFVRSIIQSCPVQNRHKHIVVDIKVHNLNAGVIPALPKWHFDCVGDPRHPAKEEVHHLFITDGSLTEFLADDIDMEFPEKFSHNIFRKADLKGTKIQPYKIHTYGRHLHRATPAHKTCRRLLVRVSETDLIRPRNQHFKVTYV